MLKLAAPVAAGVALAAGMAVSQAPAQAQAQSDSVMEVIVYGNDPCPRSAEDDVVVCHRLPETERFRLPEPYRSAGARQTREPWVNRARTLETVSATGIHSCSAVGPAGYTGCLEQLIRQNQAQAREAAREGTPPEQ